MATLANPVLDAVVHSLDTSVLAGEVIPEPLVAAKSLVSLVGQQDQRGVMPYRSILVGYGTIYEVMLRVVLFPIRGTDRAWELIPLPGINMTLMTLALADLRNCRVPALEGSFYRQNGSCAVDLESAFLNRRHPQLLPPLS